MERIVFLERGTFRVAFTRPSFDHEWVEYSSTDAIDAVERLRGASIAIVNKLPLRAAELGQLPQLKLIAIAATGVDNIDLEYCRRRGIGVCNVRNYAGHSLPEHVLMLVLTLRRNLIAYREDVTSGKWAAADQFCLLDHAIHDINGSTLGIVGYGFLGQAVARKATALGMNVLIAARRGVPKPREGRMSFEQVLGLSDVLSLHVPLTRDTKNLIAEAELRQMKTTALLINTARGNLVHEPSLLRALREGWIAGAGLDVLREEPPRNGNDLLNVDLPNLVVTPHIAWASREAMESLGRQLIANLEAFVRGEKLNRVV